jgi:hypothetical protein
MKEKNDFGWVSPTQFAHLMFWALAIFSFPIEVLTRTRFGQRYFGRMEAVLSILAGWAFGLSVQYNIIPLLQYVTFAYPILVGIHRWRAVARDRRGDFEHSFFDGLPWLYRCFPRLTCRQLRSRVEPVMMVAICILTGIGCPALGQFLVLCSICCIFKTAIVNGVYDRSDLDLRDAMILAERR